ncbi:hypothetical protein SDRG_08616 [Saprolegnia diclina VS20]|uniref:EF-hand domain-containing protein n=1 Tax=Saprolegnia diclina (strain VS20) TaxID=1156394 RepID=T0QJL6_SAPDV|nr:hypothetical protein SDRG_08616 [Saprolegnia diclina VS20]EQC33935.1 hypothetical protein SDRG_08616 [Saprolegnia diclina VS20]|eukprot:XP_008612730.1 hypothetical protein SDRG_08616 [Saprolegnia diclina VS20]
MDATPETSAMTADELEKQDLAEAIDAWNMIVDELFEMYDENNTGVLGKRKAIQCMRAIVTIAMGKEEADNFDGREWFAQNDTKNAGHVTKDAMKSFYTDGLLP